MNKKSKLILTSVSFLLAGIVTSSFLLTSCSSNNATPYAPYTSLSLNDINLNSSNYRLDSRTQEGQFYNSNSTWGNDNLNKWLSASQIRNLYYNESQKNTIQFLQNQGGTWDRVKNLYVSSNDNPIDSFSVNDFINKIKPTFFYGATPNALMKSIAESYNKVTIMSSAFQAISNLSNSIITYLACNGFSSLINNTSSVLNIASNFNSSISKEFFSGFALTFGQGKNVYHLWPSGFSAKISQTISNGSDANQPISMLNYSAGGKPNFPTQKITFSNIQLTYQWFKAKQNGGSYISDVSEINKTMLSAQKDTLNKISGNNQIDIQAFTLPIGNVTFDLIPEYYSYQDPFYRGLFDNVKTGLYKISNPVVINSNSKTDYSILYPSALQATVGETKVNWRGIVNVRKISDLQQKIPSSLYETIKSKDLNSLPYYQSNMNISIDQNKAQYTVQNLSNFNVYQMLTLLADPYNKSGNSYKDMPIYNNINDTEKENILNLWSIGWLINNPSNDKNIKDVQAYKDFKNQLKFGDKKVSAKDFIQNSNYNLGLNTIYNIINPTKITSTTPITFK